jgi:BirA family transcriptional regulator, biotin operon repressor / biotin---[acetyl-CoA-carboxylase] ligase
LDTKNLNTLFTGKFLIRLKETASTNSYMKQWLSNSKPIEGTVILTEEQTAGRGQAGTSWQSTPGENITLSLYYRPVFLEARHQFLLSMAMALGVRSTVTTLLPDKEVNTKWPNDILINHKKVCGILIENHLQGQNLSGSIIGIGLNVLQKDFPGLPMATSLTAEGFEGTLEDVFVLLMEKLEQQYLRIRNGQWAVLKSDYLESLYGLGKPLLYKDAIGSFTGIIEDVDDSGKLIMDVNGRKRAYFHKEVELLHQEG